MERDFKRFETEADAVAYAKKASRATRSVRYVIESPPNASEPMDGNPGRFVVDSDGFTRSWERSIATFENGKRD